MSDGLHAIATRMVADGKGILAMDESNPTCNKRFEALGIDQTESKRREYRDLLVGAPGLSEHISGAILYDETFHQETSAGSLFPEYLTAAGMLPGIKVDTGTKTIGDSSELLTHGLDGLEDRLAGYRSLGARFTKWRAVISIGDGLPTDGCITANAEALGDYAVACQAADLVPIVEPEVMMDGAHTIERCYDVTLSALRAVFTALADRGGDLQGIVLKPNMVLSGVDAARRAEADQVVAQTLGCLLTAVPEEVPGVAFLSGGQGDEEATTHLRLLNQQTSPAPWKLTFSYGRALQRVALNTWAGDGANTEKAREALIERTSANSRAAVGVAVS